MGEKVQLDRDALIETLRHLQMIVPSLDRIGSAAGILTDEEFRRALSDFVVDWSVGRRLSEVRRMLSEALEYDELARLYGDVEVWEIDHRKPQRKFQNRK